MRIAYLATADARGHLMRAQLLTRALRAGGASVEVLTTSAEGVRFLAAFGIVARLLSCHYAVQFDARQNMLRDATDANVASYVLRPSRMLRDIGRLRAVFGRNDLVIDDSFHPALIVMGSLPGWRRKVVHVYGASLRAALESNFEGRLARGLAGAFARVIGALVDRSRGRLAHDFADADALPQGGAARLPTPVATADVVEPPADAGVAAGRHATVYLNPHFRDPLLAEALERGLTEAGWTLHLVGEGFAGRAGWRAVDPRWVDRAAASDVIVSAPGLAALSVAAVYRRPIVLVETDQPEQRINVARAAQAGLPHRAIRWQGDTRAFAASVRAAVHALCGGKAARPCPADGAARAAARLQTWVSAIDALAH